MKTALLRSDHKVSLTHPDGSALTFPSLSSRDVCTWFLQPEGVPPEANGMLLSFLDGSERARASSFRFVQHRDHYVASHALLRAMLSAFTGIAPTTWRFAVNSYGRPEIDANICTVPLRFNLSHTDGLVACTVTLQRDVGVDVEAIDRADVDALLLRGVFTEEESAELRAKRPHDCISHFYCLWTLKEAFAKALGMGLSLPFDTIGFDLDPIRLRVGQHLYQHPAQWQFRLIQPTLRYWLAVAAREPSREELRFTWTRVEFDFLAALLRSN